MTSHDSAIYEDFLEIGISCKFGKDGMPSFYPRPSFKAFDTLFQRPKSGGKSLHGLPVRAIHKTASTNSRVSAAVQLGSEVFPSKNGLIRSYWSSLSINLGILFFRKIQNVSRLFYKITALGKDYQQALDEINRSKCDFILNVLQEAGDYPEKSVGSKAVKLPFPAS